MTTDSAVPSFSTNATAPADQNFETAPISDGSAQSSFTFEGLTFAQIGGAMPFTGVHPGDLLVVPVGLDDNVVLFNGSAEEGVNEFTVSSADGSEFRLASFDIASIFFNGNTWEYNGAKSLRITGYRDGGKVVQDNVNLSTDLSGFSTIQLTDRFVGKNGSDDASIKAKLTFDATGWGNIDSIVVEGDFAAFTSLALDNIDLEQASVPDTTPPTVVSIVRSGDNPALTNADTLTYTVTFDEPVTGVTADDFTLTMIGSVTGQITAVSTNDNTSYTVTVSNVSGAGNIRLDLKTTGTGIVDASNNGIATGYTSGQSYSVDAIAPHVTGVSSPTANGVYAIGDTVTVTVSFSEAVTVTGMPQLMLNLGGVDLAATYVSGSGSSVLAFSFTVPSGVSSADLDYTSTAALRTSGGTIRDSVGNDATLSLPAPGAAGSLGANKAIVIDGLAPTVTQAIVNGDRMVLTYSESLDVWGGANALVGGFTVVIEGQIVAISNREFGPDGKTVVITLASPVAKGQSVSVFYEDPTISDDGDAIQDVAGNDSAGFADLPVTNTTQDTGKPVVTGVSIPNAPMALGDEVTVTITVAADSDTYTLGIGSFVGPYEITNLVKVDDATYTAKFTITDANGFVPAGMDLYVGVSLLDSADNESDPFTQPISQDKDVIDGIRPVVVGSVANGSSVVLTYSEALDLTSLPPAAAFTVKVDGQSVAVTGLWATSTTKTVTLQLASPISKGQAVTVSYADPTSGDDARAIQDTVGNEAASFSNAIVDNVTQGTLIDGVGVVGSVITNPDGSRTHVIQTGIVQPGRVDETGRTAYADIPLSTIENLQALLAQLGEGSGLDARITRAELATVIMRAFNLELGQGPLKEATFSDVTSEWAANYIGAAVKAGLITTVSGIDLMGQPSRDTVISGLSTYNNLMVLNASNDGVFRKVEVNDVGFIALRGTAELYGGTGAQLIVADNASQRIVMGADDDTIHGGGGDDYVGSLGGNDELFGDEGNDTVSGGIGNDTLDGGTGYDVMYGGAGNDTYYVDMKSDTVIEYRGEGIDTVHSSVSYVLSNANIENLVLTGTASSGYGNSLSNKMQASSGGSMLYGWGGHDTLSGGASRDRLYGSSGDDRLYGNGGSDRLYGGTGKDRLDAGNGNDYVAGESNNDVLKGGDGKDTISGGSGNDMIHGGTGADVLYGGYGRDTFAFDTRLGRGEVDVIRNFNVKDDTIRLEDAAFKNISGKGALGRDAFYVGSHARDAEDRIIYDAVTGRLYYDKDGVGGAAQVQFAKLDQHLFLTGDDFRII